jgi:hypothetical protein
LVSTSVRHLLSIFDLPHFDAALKKYRSPFSSQHQQINR